MRPNAVRVTLALAVVGALSLSCGSAPPRSPSAGVDELVIPTPSPDPGDFVTRIDNPWLPLAPGNTWVYRSTGPDGDATITTTVLAETRVVAGVTTTVVHDVATAAGGRVTHETYDWYAQDRSGNVWFFGQDVRGRKVGGGATGSERPWSAGVGEAMAGVQMLAEPRRGDGYPQASLAGVVERRATVLALDAHASVPYGDFTGVLQTEETTSVGLVERRSYVRGVGLVLEVELSGGDVVELESFTPG